MLYFEWLLSTTLCEKLVKSLKYHMFLNFNENQEELRNAPKICEILF